MFGLSGIIPSMYWQALAHIFQGSGPKLVRITVLLALGLSILWFLAASYGRNATLSALIDKAKLNFTPVLRLHFLRVVVGTAAIIAYFAAIGVSASFARFEDGNGYDIGAFYFVFLILSLLIGMAWSSASWYLALGPIFAVRNGTGALDSLYDAAALVRRQSGQFTWVGFVFGATRLAFWFFAMFVFLTVLAIIGQAPGAVAFAVLVLMAAAYSAVSSLISLIRMGSYLRILDWDEQERLRPPEPVVAPVVPRPPLLDPPVIPAM
jgi:hypothetical protein